jgi:hypothetical protein
MAVWWGRGRIVALFLLTLLLFTWQYTSPTAADRGSLRSGDIDSQYYSLARWMSVRLAEGQLPLWNRDTFGGAPFLAEPQAAALYPPRWVTLAASVVISGWEGLPFWLFQVEIFAHLLIAALLTYAFCRRLALSPAAAFIGGLLFTYSGFLTTYPLEQVSILEAAVWLPGVLLGIEIGLTTSWRGWIGAFFALALSFLAGSPQITLFLGYATLAYALWRGWQQGHSWRWLAVRVGAWGVGTGLLIAGQAIPTLEWMQRSPRASASFESVRNGFAFQDVLELILPHATTIHASIYVGLLTLVLALIGVFAPRPVATPADENPAAPLPLPTVAFWGGLAVVALLVSFGGNSALFGWLYQFAPGIGLFRSQERVIFLWAFALAVLAAYGVHSLLHHRRIPFTLTPLAYLSLPALLMVATVYTYLQGHPTLPGWAFATLIATLGAVLLAWLPVAPPRLWVGAVVLLLLIDLFTIHGRTAWQDDPPEAHEEIPGLVEALPRDAQNTLLDVEGGVQPNIGAFLTVPTVSGASQLRLATYEAWYQALPRPRWWALWGVTHVASAQPDIGVPATVIGDSTINDQPHFLYEIDSPAPRVRVVESYRVVPTLADQVALLQNEQSDLLLEGEPSPAPISGGVATIGAVAIGYETWSVEVENSQPTLLRLALPHYPGWTATINGQSAPLLRADGLWSAVALPVGSHTVALRFAPLGWAVAALISALAWGGAIVGLVIRKKPTS